MVHVHVPYSIHVCRDAYSVHVVHFFLIPYMYFCNGRKRRSSPHVEGRRNSRESPSKRESRQSIESYKNETETTTTEVAIIGFEEKPVERSDESSTPVSRGGGGIVLVFAVCTRTVLFTRKFVNK